MQRFEVYGHDVETVQEDAGSWYRAEDVAAHVDELNAEIESLKAQLECRVEISGNVPELTPLAENEAAQKLLARPTRWAIPNPPSHEESYQNNLTQALLERNTLRDVLALLAPDLKAMAILYAQKGDHTRSQALANICKSVGAL
jgi:hypothetical protein